MSNISSFDEIEMYMNDLYKKYKSIKNELSPYGKIKMDMIKLDIQAMTLPFGLSKVSVRKSKVHGNGVFANSYIRKDELITFYPGDIVRFSPEGSLSAGPRGLIYSKRFEKLKGKIKGGCHWDQQYTFDYNKHYSVCGYKNFINDPNYLGHMINDGAKHNSTKRAEEIYKKISYLKSNCAFVPLKNELHVAVICLKDIEPGEELFVTYGVGYWRSFDKK